MLTRQQLEKLSAPLFKRMGKAVDEACWQVGFTLILVEVLGLVAHLLSRNNVSALVAMWMMSKYGLLSSDGT